MSQSSAENSSMVSRPIPLKRRLPAWMEQVHQQSSGVSHSGGQSQRSGPGLTQTFEADKFVDSGKLEQASPVDLCANTAVSRDSRSCVSATRDSRSCVSATRDSRSCVSASHIIEQSMQLLTFPGRVVYSCHFADCAGICDDLLTSLSNPDPVIFGFDMEWPVTFQKGSSPKTALIQLCSSEAVCYLFHVSAMTSFPASLRKLICDARVALVGLNIEGDLWKLERDYDVRVKPLIDGGSVIDLSRLANQKLKSSEQWTLDGLCKNVLRKRLNKDVQVRCGNWREIPLSEEQKLYASTDAYAGLLLYQCLIKK